MVTRDIPIYVDMASFVINELKQVGIEATLKQIETAQWHAMATRGEYQIGANLTGIGPDDPDANFYENFACGSPRNYSFYCNEEAMKLIDQQSQELDAKKRLALVHAVQKKLEEDAARPMLDWRLDYFTSGRTSRTWSRTSRSTTGAGCRRSGSTSSGPAEGAPRARLDPHAGAALEGEGAPEGTREDLPCPPACHRRPDAVRHVVRHLPPPPPGARRHRRHPLLDGRLRDPSEKQAIMASWASTAVRRQYVDWLGQFVAGDLGKSYATTSRPGRSSSRCSRSRSSWASCR